MARKTSAALTACAMLAPLAASAAAHLADAGPAPTPKGADTLCADYGWACSEWSAVIPRSELPAIAAVNRAVNRLPYRDVSGDVPWAPADIRAGGDCEQLALRKLRELLARGYPPEALHLAVGLAPEGMHAVLVVRTDAGDYVLDLIPEVLRWDQARILLISMQRGGGWRSILADDRDRSAGT